MDLLLLLAIFFGRKFLVLLLGHPIGIVEGSHCPLKRILGKLAAGKQAGHLTDQFIDVSRCFCSTLLMGFYGIDICAGVAFVSQSSVIGVYGEGFDQIKVKVKKEKAKEHEQITTSPEE